MPNIKTRIKNKHDTEANWALAENFKPYAGEVIVYDVDANHAYPRFKVGDGVTVVANLPFSTDVLTNYVTETELASALNETTSAINKNIATIDDEVATHVAATNNPHQVTKAQVNLGNVDNVRQYSASNPPPYGTLTFTGAVEDSFTASTSKTIEIPTIAGPTGAAAGFGTPTVTTTTGNPETNASVTITANTSSPNTAKVFDFAFTIPRGADGQDGSVTAISYANSNTQTMGILSNITLSGTTLTATIMNGSLGNASTPIYMSGGVFTECTSLHIDDGTL